MNSESTRRDALDLARGLSAAGRQTSWRRCSLCGELGVLRTRRHTLPCFHCTRLSPATHPVTSHAEDRRQAS